MIVYHAGYRFLDDGSVHAEVRDYPGVITCGGDLTEARAMLADAVISMAECDIEDGRPLPPPQAGLTSGPFDVEEPIYLLLSAGTQVRVTLERTG